jgi:hypothetical protein
MELRWPTWAAKRAALLASTAIIALLSACQSPNAGNGSSTTPTSSHRDEEYERDGWGGPAW